MNISKQKFENDILFVVSPANARSPYMPFYYLYLDSYLKKFNIKSKIIDSHKLTVKENIKYIMNVINNNDSEYIGLASFVTDYDLVSKLANIIKENTKRKIIVGNAQPSIKPSDYLFENSNYDIVVRGEGEETLKEILLKNNLNSINGISYWDNGKLINNPNRELLDLKEIELPSYHKIDMKWYSKPTKYLIRRIPASCAVIYTGRGCPFKCGFCAANTVWNANNTSNKIKLIRKRPIETVINELNILKSKYNYDFFYVLDDTFGIDENDIYKFCDAYKKSGLKMLWAAETRCNCINNEDIVKTLSEAGCIQLDFGVETGSEKLLNIIKKGFNVNQIENSFQLCKKAHIRTFANILINLPDENEHDLELTEKLLDKIQPSYVSISVTQPYPGTDFYDKYIKNKIDKENYSKLSRLHPPEEFRMSFHKINLQELLFKWQKKYKMHYYYELNIKYSNKIYWRNIISSRRKFKYILYFIIHIFLFPFVMYFIQIFILQGNNKKYILNKIVK